MTDESLMLCVKNDDLDKAAILYERYKKKLYQFFLYKNKNDQELSEDAVQQVFYRMIKYRKSYKDDNSFSIWIYGIARNVQYQDYNKQVKMNDAHANYQTTETYTFANDEHQAMRQAISLLPENYREVLMMSKFMDLKYEDIAVLSNCSVGVVKTRVFRAMQSLKEVYLKIS
jgi:RNA polymerase sigma-70 factor (ECF subfamily)